MHDWGYVAIAYAVVWGALAVYAILLARRLAQAKEVARVLRHPLSAEDEAGE
ncbi:MAG: hypothetical protein NVS2B16_02560 [Chloroflexota bacterium]